MKRILFSSLAVLAFLITVALAAAPAPAKQANGFDRLKGLVGDWEGTNKDGKPVHIVYTLTAAGSVVMEQIDAGEDHAMVTMYHNDGERLMMTHYCAAGNQPRMRAAKPAADGKSLTFSMIDATNLAKPNDPHMVKLIVGFDDADHISETWTFHADAGKETTEVFHLTRKA